MKEKNYVEPVEGPQMIGSSLFVCIACVPKSFTDEDAKNYVNSANPTGLTRGWELSTDEDVKCQCQENENKVHIKFDC